MHSYTSPRAQRGYFTPCNSSNQPCAGQTETTMDQSTVFYVVCMVLLAHSCAGVQTGTIKPSAHDNLCLTAMPTQVASTQGVTRRDCITGNSNQAWELDADNKLRAVGVDKCLGFSPVTDVCVYSTPECTVWTSRGECQANPNYMVGVGAQGGKCRASCKVCMPKKCIDLVPECPAWAITGECQANPAYLIGDGKQAGRCKASCKACTQSGSDTCEDVSESCAAWAASGECQANPDYMVGVGAKGGNCRASCKVCMPTVVPLQLVDCDQAPSEKWIWSSDSYFRSVRHPQLCVVPSRQEASDGIITAVSLSACPPAIELVEDKPAWRFGDDSNTASVASG